MVPSAPNSESDEPLRYGEHQFVVGSWDATLYSGQESHPTRPVQSAWQWAWGEETDSASSLVGGLAAPLREET